MKKNMWQADSRKQVLDNFQMMKLVESRGRVFKVLGPMIEATGLQRRLVKLAIYTPHQVI